MSKQYIVTDPCYLIDRANWHQMCQATGADTAAFKQQVEDTLQTYTPGAVVADTGVGDWQNRLVLAEPTEALSITGDAFAADSGMVCIAEVTMDLINYHHDQLRNDFTQNIRTMVNRGLAQLIDAPLNPVVLPRVELKITKDANAHINQSVAVVHFQNGNTQEDLVTSLPATEFN